MEIQIYLPSHIRLGFSKIPSKVRNQFPEIESKYFSVPPSSSHPFQGSVRFISHPEFSFMEIQIWSQALPAKSFERFLKFKTIFKENCSIRSGSDRKVYAKYTRQTMLTWALNYDTDLDRCVHRVSLRKLLNLPLHRMMNRMNRMLCRCARAPATVRPIISGLV